MKIKRPVGTKFQGGFSLIEVVVCSGIMAVVFLALYGGISYGFAVLQLARENLRANQILVEKLETIRLYTWEQINSNGFIPSAFQESFFPAAAQMEEDEDEGESNTGLIYYGSISISDAPISESYSNSMKSVRVSVLWTNSSLPRTREIETFVSQYGMQKYIQEFTQE